jgi:DNA adenine methylase
MQFFPPHKIYVEPFGGAAGVLLQKPRSYSEVYNDLDDGIVNLMRVMRDREQRDQLLEILVLTPYSRTEFLLAYEPTDDPAESARRTIIRAQMGFGSAGATKGATGFRSDANRDYGTAAHLWAQYPDCLASIGQRLAGVMIENRPAVDLIRDQDSPETLFFVDPPYVMDTRVMRTSSRYYKHEMTDADHLELINVLRSVRGMVVLSGYESDLYSSALSGWEQHTTNARISAGRGSAIRTECVYLNPRCADELHQNIDIFQEVV